MQKVRKSLGIVLSAACMNPGIGTTCHKAGMIQNSDVAEMRSTSLVVRQKDINEGKTCFFSLHS